jgi:hypothetical protein
MELKHIIPNMEQTFGQLEYAGEGAVEQRRINGKMTVLSRSYNLYSTVQRADDIVVILPADVGEKHFEVEDKVKLIQPKITAEGYKIGTRGFTNTLTVYIDKEENMVITKNPTISSRPTKPSYEPKKIENDGTIDAKTTEEINLFLETFFKLYPKASEKELAYYVSENVLRPVGKDYVFVELIDPVFTKKDNQVQVRVSVKYLDQQTKAVQLFQYNLVLQKYANWRIIN